MRFILKPTDQGFKDGPALEGDGVDATQAVRGGSAYTAVLWIDRCPSALCTAKMSRVWR